MEKEIKFASFCKK